MSDGKSYQAVVDKIIPDGKHGPYAVTRHPELGSITFSLSPSVWQEEDKPEPGVCVMLSQIRKKRAGWYAQNARFVGPSDELQSATSTQQSATGEEHSA